MELFRQLYLNGVMACLVYSSAKNFQLVRLKHIVCANDKSDGHMGYDSVLKPPAIRKVHLMQFM